MTQCNASQEPTITLCSSPTARRSAKRLGRAPLSSDRTSVAPRSSERLSRNGCGRGGESGDSSRACKRKPQEAAQKSRQLSDAYQETSDSWGHSSWLVRVSQAKPTFLLSVHREAQRKMARNRGNLRKPIGNHRFCFRCIEKRNGKLPETAETAGNP